MGTQRVDLGRRTQEGKCGVEILQKKTFTLCNISLRYCIKQERLHSLRGEVLVHRDGVLIVQTVSTLATEQTI